MYDIQEGLGITAQNQIYYYKAQYCQGIGKLLLKLKPLVGIIAEGYRSIYPYAGLHKVDRVQDNADGKGDKSRNRFSLNKNARLREQEL